MKKGVLILSSVLVIILFFSIYSLALQISEDGSGGGTINVACKNPSTENLCTYGSTNCALYINGVLSDNDDDHDTYYQYCGNDCDDNNNQIYIGHSLNCNDGLDHNCNGLIDKQEDACIPEYTITTSYDLTGNNFVLKADTTPYISKCCYSTNTGYANYEDAKKGICTEMTPDSKEITFVSNSITGTAGQSYTYKVYCRKKVATD